MQIKTISLLLVLLGLVACNSGNTRKSQHAKAAEYNGTGTLVLEPVKFANNASVRSTVRNDCHLTEKLEKFIDQYAADHYAQILTNTDIKSVPADTRILKVEIDNVRGGGGGAWSGGKSVAIKGTLSENGNIIGDFRGRRVSGGGMFAEFKGTCSIMGRCVKALGRDVAEWLQSPSKGAVLGDY